MDLQLPTDLEHWLPVIRIGCDACGATSDAVVQTDERPLQAALTLFFDQHLAASGTIDVVATGRVVLPSQRAASSAGAVQHA